jgi:NAD(P)-dependent dehydrogenase (short-subunit alcohol dehydrogenase family)
MYNPFSLEKKTILVTGASSGIGQQTAILCSKMGAKVAIIGRNQERLQQTLSQMEGEGHFMMSFDLTETENIKDIVADIVSKLGPIDGLVCCAGISGILPLKLMSVEHQQQYFRTNVFATIELTRQVLGVRNVNKKGASIIFISSIMGVVGENAKSLYSMTKGALISASRSLAVEYAKKKVRVNCISPGVVITPINVNQPYIADIEKRAILEAKHPLGLGNTVDIANVCIFLLSDASRWVTGQNLIIDGGYTIQ